VTRKSNVAAAMLAESLVCLKKAAERQDPQGMARLGESYREGAGVGKDPAEAFRWSKKSADLGSARGKYDLALALYSGAGVSADKPAALKLAEEAASEVPDAAGFFGLLLWRGDCGPHDIAEGIKWMDTALKKDYWPAGLNLAEIYHLGPGVPKDEPRARDYLAKAAEVQDESAQHAVAEAFEKGKIIAQDKDEADTRFEKLGNARGGNARNGGFVAAHYLRQGDKKKATWWVLYGGDKADPEIIRVGTELENDVNAMVAAELPAALATLDKNLALLEAAAASFKPTGERTSFFSLWDKF
jgi:TPR repeat protein